MSENSAQDFIRVYPDRQVKAYILGTPMRSQGEKIFILSSYVIFTTIRGDVIYIYPDQINNSFVSSTSIPSESVEILKNNIFRDLTKDLPDNDWFFDKNKSFVELFQKVWHIVSKVVQDNEEAMISLDSINGIIMTELTEHGSHKSRVVILIQQVTKEKTAVFVKGFWYFSIFDPQTSKHIWVEMVYRTIIVKRYLIQLKNNCNNNPN